MHSSPRFYMQNSPCPALPCNLMSLQSFYNEWNIYCSCTAYRMKSVTISSLLASFFSPLTVISSGGVSVLHWILDIKLDGFLSTLSYHKTSLRMFLVVQLLATCTYQYVFCTFFIKNTDRLQMIESIPSFHGEPWP